MNDKVRAAVWKNLQKNKSDTNPRFKISQRSSPISSGSSDNSLDESDSTSLLGDSSVRGRNGEKNAYQSKKKYHSSKPEECGTIDKEEKTDPSKEKGDCRGPNEKRFRPNSYKAYHRQIEKRRRSKINDMINEIASLVPMCQNVTHRLDKLSILELAVQHMRMVTSSQNDHAYSVYKPQILSEDEIKHLLENTSDGFLLVLSCDKLQILYVSDAVSKATLHSPMELVGRSLLELVHSKDIPVITSMLTPHPQIPVVGTPSCSSSTNDTLYASNGAKIGHSMTGAKRSFYFRLKTSKQPQFDASKASKSHRYKQSLSGISMVTVQCSGFLKSWQTSIQSVPVSGIDADVHLSTFACFIAVASPVQDQCSTSGNTYSLNNSKIKFECTSNQKPIPLHYSSRHTADAKYLFVDERVLPLAGYLPQDLVGHCEYKFVHKDDISALSETYRQALENKDQERFVSDVYRFKMKHGGLLPIRTVAFSLFNPYTKELEFILHENFVIGGKETYRSLQRKSVHMPANQHRLELKAKFDAIGRIHDEAEEQDVPPNNWKALQPFSINVLKYNGVNTDVINEILQRHSTKTLIKKEIVDDGADDEDCEFEDSNFLSISKSSPDVLPIFRRQMSSDEKRPLSSGYGTGDNSG